MINFDTLKVLMGNRLNQNIAEWRWFIELVTGYFENRSIEHPIVVELGIWHGQQKIFYEEFLDAEYIGIDMTAERAVPDILGNTHDEQTVAKLKSMLRGRPINLLFIDACHDYEAGKRDYEIYSPLTRNIVAIHDIVLQREEVRLFWKEICLPQEHIVGTIIGPARFHSEKVLTGIGLIIKEW